MGNCLFPVLLALCDAILLASKQLALSGKEFHVCACYGGSLLPTPSGTYTSSQQCIIYLAIQMKFYHEARMLKLRAFHLHVPLAKPLI